MTARALIVAVEQYARAADLDRDLPGTLAAADLFRRWLVDVKGVEPGHILECRNATRQQIVDAVQTLVETGRRDTGELFVFFSGHGFSLPAEGDKPPPDVFVAADFEDLQQSAAACIKLNELSNRLAGAMTFGSHYYFIDICRNLAPLKDPGIPPLPDFGLYRNKRPYTYLLFSTNRGEIAAGESGFSSILCDGLAGRGRAKQWTGQAGQLDLSRMVVTFQKLQEYVIGQMGHQKAQQQSEGDLDREILVLSPPPQFSCTIRIDQALAGEEFSARITGSGTRSRLHQPLIGAEHRLTLVPDGYWIELTPSQDAVDPIELHADLYGDCEVRFRKSRRGPGPIPVASGGKLATLEVIGASNTTVRIRNLETGEQREAPNRFLDQVSPGTYRLSLIEAERVEIRSAAVSVLPGETLVFDLGRRPATPAKDGILKALPDLAWTDREVKLSESLGPFASGDLALWLAVIGASRIQRDSGLVFQAGRGMPFQQFEDIKPNDSPIYLLMGFEDGSSSTVMAGRSTGGTPAWIATKLVAGFPGISEVRIDAPPGPQLFSLKLDRRSSLTIPTHCLPNRATLIVATRSSDGEIHIRQFILPLGHLVNQLPAELRNRLPGDPPIDPEKPGRLAMVKFLAQSQELFAARRPVAPPVGSNDYQVWNGLLAGTWLDPIMILVAAYALLREDQLEPSVARSLVANLRTYFPGMADTEAIARMAGLDYVTPSSPPLFLDGLAAFPHQPSVFPLPESGVDYRAPWVRWRGSVEDPVPPPPPPQPSPPPSPPQPRTWMWIITAGLAVIAIVLAVIWPKNPSFRILPADTTLTVGQALQLHIDPSGGNPWTWRSADGSVSVSPDGSVVALTPGVATIVAEREGESHQSQVRVIETPGIPPGPDENRISGGEDFSLEVGEQRSLAAQVTDATGQPLNLPLTWSTADATSLQIDGSRVIGLQPGVTAIVVTSDRVSDTVLATVVPASRILPADTTIEVGETFQLRVEPAGGEAWTWQGVSPDVLNVSNDGIVTGIGAGTGGVAAERNGVIRETSVVVNLPGTVTMLPVSPLSFGTTVAGQTGASQIITIDNPRHTALTNFSVALSGGNESYTLDNQCGAVVPAMSRCSINVGFAPRSAGFRPGDLSIGWLGDETAARYRLSGSATPPPPQPITVGVRGHATLDESVIPTACDGPLVWHPVPGDNIQYVITVEAVRKDYPGGGSRLTSVRTWIQESVQEVRQADTVATPTKPRHTVVTGAPKWFYRWTVRALTTGGLEGAKSDPFFFACEIG
jgi:hypothetical protein